jgi:hypothetical protein
LEKYIVEHYLLRLLRPTDLSCTFCTVNRESIYLHNNLESDPEKLESIFTYLSLRVRKKMANAQTVSCFLKCCGGKTKTQREIQHVDESEIS